MEKPGASGSNLSIVIGTPSPSEFAHTEALVRGFLATEYAAVTELLRANRRLLDTITERLLWDPVIDQSKLRALCVETGVMVGG